MTEVKGKCCERKLLYEVETPGLLYLTLDGKDPVYVGFQHRLKLEIRLVHPEGLSKTLLNSGKLDPVTPWGSTTNKIDLTDESKSLDVHPKLSVITEKPVVLVASPESSDTCNLEESDESLSFTSVEASGAFLALKQQNTTACNQMKSSHSTGTSKPRVKNPNMAVLKHKAEKQFQLSSRKASKKAQGAGKGSNVMDSKNVREQVKSKLLMLNTQGNKDTMILSRKQLEVYKFKTSNKQSSSGVDLHNNESGASQLLKSDFEKEQREINQDAEQSFSSTGTKSMEMPLTCKYCAQSFSSQKEYYKHRKYSVLNYHVCLKCNVAFPFKAYLLAHIKYHNEKGLRSSYDCETCKFKTSNFGDLKRHMIVHTREHSFQCCQCFKTFMTHTLLLRHLATHRPKGLFRCSCCNEYFPSRGALSDHKMSLLQLTCGLCGQVFPNSASRRIHYLTHHKDTILKCPHCDRVYSDKEELTRHFKWHKDRTPKQCTICGAVVFGLSRHLLTHKSIDEMPESEVFACDQCFRKFKTSTQLKNHMRTHSKEKVKCHLCPKTFPRRSGLSRHMYNVHSNFMRHQCEICGKKCKQKANLTIHMRIHSDVKLFPCNFCEQAFNYKASLNAHIKSKHSSNSTAGPAIPNVREMVTLSEPLDKADVHNDAGTSTIFLAPCDTSGYSPQVMTSHVQYPESSASWLESGTSPLDSNALVWTVDMTKVSNPGLGQNTPDLATLDMHQQSMDHQQQ